MGGASGSPQPRGFIQLTHSQLHVVLSDLPPPLNRGFENEYERPRGDSGHELLFCPKNASK